MGGTFCYATLGGIGEDLRFLLEEKRIGRRALPERTMGRQGERGEARRAKSHKMHSIPNRKVRERKDAESSKDKISIKNGPDQPSQKRKVRMKDGENADCKVSALVRYLGGRVKAPMFVSERGAT